MVSEQPKNKAAVALGRLGGKGGRGQAKSRAEQVKAWWQSPGGEALRARRAAARQAAATHSATIPQVEQSQPAIIQGV